MSLYLKYRPQDFKTVVGQEHAKQTLQSAFKLNQLAHAYLFCGPRGTGKTSMARIVAKRINCLNPADNEPCNACEICLAINQGALVDLIEIDAASNRGIDDIRELREKILFSPSLAKAKVYIIDEVHMLTKEAFNALLKTLEEPPSHAFFILATTEAHKIPETIISRCQQFSFTRISEAQITERLAEIVQAESGKAEGAALELIAKLSEGGLRDAIGLLEQMLANGEVTAEAVSNHLGLTGHEHLSELLTQLKKGEAMKALEILKTLMEQGKSPTQFLKEWIEFLRQEMLSHLKNGEDMNLLMGYIEAFLAAKRQMEFSPLPHLPLEVAMIKVCQSTKMVGAPKALQTEPETSSPAIKESPSAQNELSKVPVAPTPTMELAPKASGVELNLSEVKKSWPSVLKSIKTPFLKMSLADSLPTDYQNNTLTLHFNSDTFKSRVAETSNQIEIQEVFKEIYGCGIPLDLKTKSPSAANEISTKNENPSAADMAAEVFGL